MADRDTTRREGLGVIFIGVGSAVAPFFAEEVGIKLPTVVAGACLLAAVIAIVAGATMFKWPDAQLQWPIRRGEQPSATLTPHDPPPIAVDPSPARPTIEFYKTRTELTKVLGSLKEQLDSATVVWASWYAGTYAATQEVFTATHKPQRIILFNPMSPMMQDTVRHFKRSQEQFAQDVQTTIDKAIDAGLEVCLYDGPMTLMVIGDPESGDGWVRVELTIPDSAERPSIVIRQAVAPVLFHEYVRAFKWMWDRPTNTRIM